MSGPPGPPLNALDYQRLGDAALAASDPGLAGYVRGGASGEWTLRANREAFDRWALCPRAMRGVERVDLGVEVLGARLSMPVLAAPLAYLGMAAERGEMATARALAALGTAMCVSPFATVPLADLAGAGEGPAPWFQLYLLRDRGATRALAEQAAAAGAGALVVTVDAPRLGRRERDLGSGFEISGEVSLPMLEAASSRHRAMSPVELFELVDAGAGWSRVEELAGLTELPLVVKGVLAGEDARAARDHGAAGVVVSNHGGRQLDGARASLEALPEVAEALGGRGAVLLDGGVRRAADVVKALALGADAVLLGRPVFWALAARGEAGVAHLLGLLRDELELALALLGCAAPSGIGPEHLRAAQPSFVPRGGLDYLGRIVIATDSLGNRAGEGGSMPPLSEFREGIDEIDEQIVDLLARRFAIAREVGEHKRAGGEPMMQPDRMREVVDRVVLLAGDRGLPRDLVRGLYDSIVEATCGLEAEIVSGNGNGAGGRAEGGLPERALAIDHVAIAVRSLPEAVAHFRDTFGFEVVEERKVDGEFSGMDTAVLVAGGVKLVLVQGTSPASNVSRYIDRYGPGVQHLAIRVDAAEAVLDDLRARGCDLLTGVIHADGLDQVFTRRDENTGMQVEFISRSKNEGFSDSNVRELFEAMEREHVF